MTKIIHIARQTALVKKGVLYEFMNLTSFTTKALKPQNCYVFFMMSHPHRPLPSPS